MCVMYVCGSKSEEKKHNALINKEGVCGRRQNSCVFEKEFTVFLYVEAKLFEREKVLCTKKT